MKRIAFAAILFASPAYAQYFDGLPVAASVNPTDIVPICQGGITGIPGTCTPRRTTAAQLGAGGSGAGLFTTLAASGAVSGAGFTALLAPYLTSATAASTYQPLLGFTPYNATNPAGFQTAANLTSALASYAPLASPHFTGTINGAAMALSGNATVGGLAGTSTGVFTNSAMSNPFQIMVNGTNPQTEYQFSHAGDYASQGFAVGLTVPSSSTVYEADGFVSYVNNGSTATGSAAGSFYIRNSIAGAVSWAANLLATDGNSSASYASTVMLAEGDVGCFNVASSCYGYNTIGVFPNGTPATAAAYMVSALNSPWQLGFWTSDGAAQTAMRIGSLANAANSDGQPFTFVTHNAANTVETCTLQAQHQSVGENLALVCPSGGGLTISQNLLVAGVVSFTGSMASPLPLAGYTIASGANQIPTCNTALKGFWAYAIDLTSPTYGATAAGGGSVVRPVFCNGTNWIS